MDYLQPLKYHFKPKRGFINDPNGLVWFDGWYHVFYQYCPHHEIPRQEPVCWGHARTRDFLTFEELPVALTPDKPYDAGGCWSGTATVREGLLYLFYASVDGNGVQTVSVATSADGIHFSKYEGNPVIDTYLPDGCPDFRDPAVARVGNRYYCVMASGFRETHEGRLLLYESDDLLAWRYQGVLRSWQGSKYTECPSLVPTPDGAWLTTSVSWFPHGHEFATMWGRFADGGFTPLLTGCVDQGPDQYAGQVFADEKGRALMLSWIPGWSYAGYAARDVGCLSLPKELTVRDGRLCGYPPTELQHLLTDTDPALEKTAEGFVIHRTGREDVVHRGEVLELKCLRDGYVLEVFVNHGEAIYTVLL